MSTVQLSRTEMLALRGVPGLAGLPGDISLPESTPTAPWSCRVEAVLWWHRAVRAAGEAAGLAEGPLAGRRVTWVTLAAMVRYLDSPVGPYSEIFASPVLVAGRRGVPSVTVPFIAVDSPASVQGGRAHWALPKVLASFAWTGLTRVDAVGAGWSVEVEARGRGPAVPLGGRLPTLQPFPDGQAYAGSVRQRGRYRLGSAEVSVEGESLRPWLLPGRHRAVIIAGGRMRVGAPAPL